MQMRVTLMLALVLSMALLTGGIFAQDRNDNTQPQPTQTTHPRLLTPVPLTHFTVEEAAAITSATVEYLRYNQPSKPQYPNLGVITETAGKCLLGLLALSVLFGLLGMLIGGGSKTIGAVVVIFPIRRK